MHFGDYTFIVLLALILFGPKRLPEIGRQVGRLMMEFRRASNEFKMQMEDELRNLEEEDRRKKLDAAAAATPSISQPHALPSEITQAETLSNAEPDPADLARPFTPPLPDEECIDPVDFLDPSPTRAQDLYPEDSPDIEDRYSAYRSHLHPDSEDYGPEISSEPSDSSAPTSYLPSDEPSGHLQPDVATHESTRTPQDPVRPESDTAIHHA